MHDDLPHLPKLPEETKEWLKIRKEAGQKIDPETAEVMWTYVQTMDPYGLDPDLPDEDRQIERGYFARAPGSEIWVHFGDLPEETYRRLWEMHKHSLAFPAGLPFCDKSIDLEILEQAVKNLACHLVVHAFNKEVLSTMAERLAKESQKELLPIETEVQAKIVDFLLSLELPNSSG